MHQRGLRLYSAAFKKENTEKSPRRVALAPRRCCRAHTRETSGKISAEIQVCGQEAMRDFERLPVKSIPDVSRKDRCYEAVVQTSFSWPLIVIMMMVVLSKKMRMLEDMCLELWIIINYLYGP
ncbi:hypothetical protein F2Q68_00011439 [Brassica cretica]|uniref:Uncharacterized protein n=1 Tax=Brassica cretica TaxID=69181 RepID=A0A3N6PYB7_BRACR|nr:hypothetical protein F2Q68_00011439 [Brassica cretica]